MNSFNKYWGLSAFVIITASSNAWGRVTLPIEVMGAPNTVETVSLQIANSHLPCSNLLLRVHGVEWSGEASVKINNSGWIPIDNDHVTITGPGYSGRFGGIGGPVTLFDLRIPVPTDAVQSGDNNISFRLNAINSVNSGYRILRVNFEGRSGELAAPSTEFVKSDPALWKPSFDDRADIAEGKHLFQTATLLENGLPGAGKMHGYCSDCHAEDGRDLSYFNYSNKAITVRSEYHGLTKKQGEQIASYIRSLPFKSRYGRPWNPPFQPGSGLDARGPSEWSAGAGIDAVLPDDIAMKPYLFPAGMTFNVHDRMNVRDVPIAFPLLDWNHWLPTQPPQDIWFHAAPGQLGEMDPSSHFAGSEGDFEQSHIYIAYQRLREHLREYSRNQTTLMNYLKGDFRKELDAMMDNRWSKPKGTSPEIYNFALWRTVKDWELQEQFGLNTLAPQVSLYRGAKPGNVQAVEWFGGVPFSNSPFRLGIENKTETAVTGNILGDGYIGADWYFTQMILNPGDGISPAFTIIDWGYMPGPFMWIGVRGKFPVQMLITEIVMKSMQLHDAPTLYTGASGQKFNNWHPWWAGGPATLLFYFPRLPHESGLSEVVNAVTLGWLAKNKEFSPSEWNASAESVKGGTGMSRKIINNSLQRANGRFLTTDTEMAVEDWAKNIWPSEDLRRKVSRARVTNYSQNR